jgi:hypothetical protein
MRYDLEERVLFWCARVMRVSIDRAYSSRVVRCFMRLSARLSGISVRRPR